LGALYSFIDLCSAFQKMCKKSLGANSSFIFFYLRFDGGGYVRCWLRFLPFDPP